jgi:hypothetical protein
MIRKLIFLYIMESGNLKKLPIKQDIETKKVLKKLASAHSGKSG